MTPGQGTASIGGHRLVERNHCEEGLCEACVPCQCLHLCLQLQTFLSTLGTAAGSSGGLFAPKPLFWERPAFVIWTAAQPEPAKAEQTWADANNAYKGLKLKYDRSRDTVTRTG